MKILFMGNNKVGAEILQWLVEQGENLVGLVLHPPKHRKFGQEMCEITGLNEEDIIPGHRLREPFIVDQIKKRAPDLIVSVLFNYILKPNILSIPPLGCINLHPSYLPYNRGQYPNVWSIVDGTPSGVSLHYIDAGIDTGDLIAQQKVDVEPVDTGATLYAKLEWASVDLFKRTWPSIKSGQASRISQMPDGGTYHRTRDVEHIDHIDLDKDYKARDLINILRARSFAPYKGAYFEEDGRRIYMQLDLAYEEDL